MNRTIPEPVAEQFEKLKELMEKDPHDPCVGALDVAKLLGMDVNCLRTAAEQGSLPFGFGGKANPHANRFTKIPKLTLWAWMTKGLNADEA